MLAKFANSLSFITYALNVSRFNFCVSGVPPSKLLSRCTLRRFSIISLMRGSDIRIPDVLKAYKNEPNQMSFTSTTCLLHLNQMTLTAKNFPIGNRSVLSLRNISNSTSSAFLATVSRWLCKRKKTEESWVFIKISENIGSSLTFLTQFLFSS